MNIIFFTGAGVSEESGIPTFRGKDDSLWNNYDVNIVADTRSIHTHLDQVLDFHNTARKLIENCEPNYCHQQIAKLQEDHNVVVITTNIDDLHERAGSNKVIHLHGNIFEQCDIKRKGVQPCKEDINVGDLHSETGIQLRHNTVLFNENLLGNIDRLFSQIVREADLLVLVGAGLSVYPSNEIVYFNDNIIYLDPNANEVFLQPHFQTIQFRYIPESACDGIDAIINIINNTK